MKAVLRQAGLLLVALAALYGVLLVIALIVLPWPDEARGLDTAGAGRTIFMTEPKYVFLSRSALRSERPQVVLVGASNVVVGLRQREVASLVEGAVVHNLAIGGANMTEVRQIVDLAQEMLSPAARRRTVFVIGTWYGMFFTDRQHWSTPDRHAGDTDIDIERLRYGFYRRGSTGPVELLPAAYLDLGVAAIRPYLALERLSRDATKAVRDRLFKSTPERSEQQRNQTVVSEADRQQALEHWRTTIGSESELADEQFLVLRRMVDDILASGARVVLADLPIPSWHAQRSPYMASYRQHAQRLFADLAGRPGLSILRMADLDADDDFYDEVHPKPRVTMSWARRLADALGPVMPRPADVVAAPAGKQQAERSEP